MKPPKRKRVSETFEATVKQDCFGSRYLRDDKSMPLVLGKKFMSGDRVRVKVTKLERGK